MTLVELLTRAMSALGEANRQYKNVLAEQEEMDSKSKVVEILKKEIADNEQAILEINALIGPVRKE